MYTNNEQSGNIKSNSLTPKVNPDNEKVKRKYFDYLRGPKGFTELTINAINKAINLYETFSNYEDFRKFNSEKAKNYIKWLEQKKDPKTEKQITLTTCYHYLRHLKEFFKWLSYLSGYKSRICYTDAEYLRLDKQKSRIATASKREEFPTLEQVKKVIESIEINSEIDLRDRALISFTLLSGMRDSAIVTLPIGCFDENTLAVYQEPNKGVKTKFSKTIHSYLFAFDESMLKYFTEWYKHLKQEKLFGNSDPVFPRNKVEQAENSKTFISNTIEPHFWQSVTSMRNILKERFKNAGVPYFPPNSFRHLAVSIATKKCKNAEELKAVSQIFGHENIGTTFQTYGTLNNSKVKDIISSMNFSGTDEDDSDLRAKLKALLANDQKGSNFSI